MKAFVISAPGRGRVEEVPAPQAGPGQVVVDVKVAGICGTDVALYHSDPDEIRRHRLTQHPLRPGHEWCGIVTAIGLGVDQHWLTRRVTADTMIGCGHCHRCLAGRHHLCEERSEIGVRRGLAGALAEQLLVPERALYAIPDSVSDYAAAMIEPGANAYRAVAACNIQTGNRTLVIGPGTIGLLALQFATAAGAEVHVLGQTKESSEPARQLGAAGSWTDQQLPELRWDAVIEATGTHQMPARAIELVEPGGRVVLVGIASRPSPADTRLITRKDLTTIGILGGSAGIAPTLTAYEDQTVDPAPLIGAVIGLEQVDRTLHDWPSTSLPDGSPKILVDPRP